MTVLLTDLVGTFVFEAPPAGLLDATGSGSFVVNLSPDGFPEIFFSAGGFAISDISSTGGATLPVVSFTGLDLGGVSLPGVGTVPAGVVSDITLDFNAASDGAFGPDATFMFTLGASDPVSSAAVAAFETLLIASDPDGDGSIGGRILDADLSVSVVPEPGSAAALALGAAALAGTRRRR